MLFRSMYLIVLYIELNKNAQVAVGMYRLGPSSTSSILGEYPDIAVYGKMLSGGYLPLAATLATSETFNAFLGKKKWHALLHGHSFTVHLSRQRILLLQYDTIR